MIMNERTTFTSKEKVAQSVNGIEVEHLAMNSDRDIDTLIKQETVSKFNQAVSDYSDKFDSYKTTLEEAGKRLAENINGIECKPVYDRVHVIPYSTNPFQKITKEGQIIVDLGGANPEYKSNETGQIEEEQSYIIVGDVVDVGLDVKYVKPGDVIMYIRSAQIPVPLYNTGLMAVPERSIIAVINDNLTERYKEIENGKK